MPVLEIRTKFTGILWARYLYSYTCNIFGKLKLWDLLSQVIISCWFEIFLVEMILWSSHQKSIKRRTNLEYYLFKTCLGLHWFIPFWSSIRSRAAYIIIQQRSERTINLPLGFNWNENYRLKHELVGVFNVIFYVLLVNVIWRFQGTYYIHE